ncbi:MAG: hypothetical protein ACJA2S_001061 [Cyclobacteriaceae bacterium]|jgi:hypothetical protein
MPRIVPSYSFLLKVLEKNSKCYLLTFFVFTFLNSEAQLIKIHETTGFMDFNGYYDSRGHAVSTINMLANASPRIQYFSFTNNFGDSESADVSSFYSEHNVRWQIKKESPVYLNTQYVARTGVENNNVKLGLLLRLNEIKRLRSSFERINMSYSIAPMIIQLGVKQSNKYFPQIEHAYRITLSRPKVYLGGFADQNLIDGTSEWVTEHQLGIGLFQEFYLVLEYKYNCYLTKKQGVAVGLEYKILF